MHIRSGPITRILIVAPTELGLTNVDIFPFHPGKVQFQELISTRFDAYQA
jgi:hypothetical protein